MNGCPEKITIGYRKHDSSPIEVNCGSYNGGRMELCETHLKVCEERFPQGWRGYPGDICKHGVYTGGSGADLMCDYCESGYEEEDFA